MIKQIVAITSLLFLLFSVSCKKDIITTESSAKLSFSLDTLTFDTVFTEMGSATRRFMIYNRNSQSVIVSNITLRGGSSSSFRLNVNGLPGTTFTDMEIKGNDSAFVFAEVTVDPNDDSNPFFIFDSVEFQTNGNLQKVILSAWGQNAYYYKPTVFRDGFPPYSLLGDYGDYFTLGAVINLPNDKPHVIYGFLVINSDTTLNIPAGTQLHFFDKSGLWAYSESTLNVNGTTGNEVVFQGTRLEEYYDDKPGQWDRIILNEGPADHTFNYAVIKNAFIGIQAEELYLDGDPQLATNSVELKNTIIQNSAGLGMLVRNHNIKAENLLVANSGNVLMGLQGAGTHTFLHSTIANFWRFGSRSDETLLMTNYFIAPINGEQLEVAGDFQATFNNCIIYGTNEEELATDSSTTGQFNYIFENCVLRTKKDTLDLGLTGKFKNIVLNPQTSTSTNKGNPLFFDPYEDDFLLYDSSRAVNKGNILLTGSLLEDLKGDMRDNLPDLGCYEY